MIINKIINKMIKSGCFVIEGEDRWFYQHDGVTIRRWDSDSFTNHLIKNGIDKDIVDIIARDCYYICCGLPEAKLSA